MNELLEAKLIIVKIKVRLMDLVGELTADDLSDNQYAISRILSMWSISMNMT